MPFYQAPDQRPQLKSEIRALAKQIVEASNRLTMVRSLEVVKSTLSGLLGTINTFADIAEGKFILRKSRFKSGVTHDD